MSLVLGYDPGGLGANGVACLQVGEKAETATVDSVDEGIRWFYDVLGAEKPKAIGIDSYLSWETGSSGSRGPDRWLRETYSIPEVKKSILFANSAFGSMAIQGVTMAIRLREIWPDIILNEVHPKVLYYALTENVYKKPENKNGSMPTEMCNWLSEVIGIGDRFKVKNDHEFDALLAAWATHKGLNGEFPHNLMEKSLNPIWPAGKPEALYYWPSH